MAGQITIDLRRPILEEMCSLKGSQGARSSSLSDEFSFRFLFDESHSSVCLTLVCSSKNPAGKTYMESHNWRDLIDKKIKILAPCKVHFTPRGSFLGASDFDDESEWKTETVKWKKGNDEVELSVEMRGFLDMERE